MRFERRGGDRRKHSVQVAVERRSEARRNPGHDPSEGQRGNSGYKHVKMYPNGNYKSFVPEVNTRWIVLNVEVALTEGITVEFYMDGTLKSCVLAKPVVISIFGVKAKLKEGTPLEFHPGGEIRRCVLASQGGLLFGSKTWKYQGHTFPPGAQLEFTRSGQLVGVASPSKEA
jgi:hypothetical protein